MTPTIHKYLEKRSLHRQWPLCGGYPEEGLRTVVVIPALAERDHLFETLSALSLASESAQSATLVIVVVNNRDPEGTPPDQIANNRDTLELLQCPRRQKHLGSLNLAWVDASSPGRTLPANEGVGFARKIGLDHGLHLLGREDLRGPVLVSMDADAPPATGYLDALTAFYDRDSRWAGYAAYLHTFPDTETQTESIVAHEIYMRYHETALRYAGSPYAYPALGSIISCTPQAYAASGGMNRRHAGEDFYFMQQLTKTGLMEPVPYALVFPSGRVSTRTPFGTGRSVSGYQLDSSLEMPVPPFCCYEFLRRFFLLIQHDSDREASELAGLSSNLHPELAAFLEKNHFQETWQQLKRHHPDKSRRIRQFHVWFDGLRTIQFFHHLRASGFPDVPARTALPALFAQVGITHPEPSGTEFLRALRESGLRRHLTPGLRLPSYSAEVFRRLPATS